MTALSDISAAAVERARQGLYNARALRLVPPEVLRGSFVPAAGGCHQVREEVRSRVQFRVQNLLADRPPADRLDIIFCRNVMIYFDRAAQVRLVDGIFADALGPGGYLFVGHSESLSGLSRRFAYAAELKAPIYRRRGEGQA